VAVGEWGHILVERLVVARSDDVSHFMCEGIGQGRTGMVHDNERFLGIGMNAGGKTTAGRIIDE
jgi:hypothetical protein